MRYKRKIDVLFWWIVMLLPVFVAAIGCINHTLPETFNALQSLFFDTSLTQLLYTFFETIGYTGVSTTFLSGLLSYFIVVLLAHLIFDFLMLIPRWIMNTMDTFSGDKNV